MVHPYQRQRYGQRLEALKDGLGQAEFVGAWADGEALPIEEAKSRALELAAALLGGND